MITGTPHIDEIREQKEKKKQNESTKYNITALSSRTYYPLAHNLQMSSPGVPSCHMPVSLRKISFMK